MKDFPADLKARLAADADERGSNLKDVAVGIIAAAFGFPFTPSGRRGGPIGPSNHLNLDLPRGLWKIVRNAAAERETTMRAIGVGAIEKHYAGAR